MTVSSTTAFAIRDARFKLEQLIALDLLEFFNNTKELKEQLCEMAHTAVSEMLQDKHRSAFEAAAAAEKDLSIWKKDFGAASAISLFDVSGVVRLYGAFVEKLGGPEAASKETFRPGIGALGKDVVWGQNARAGGKRLRESTMVGEGARRGFNPHTSRQAMVTGQLTGGGSRRGWQSYGYKEKQVRGIDLKQAIRGSLVRTIDDIFCLPVGADISGTTSDTVYFLKKFSGRGFDIAVYLLPLATIVRERHHSFTEAALALSANKETTGVDYRIGDYRTLCPDGTRYKGELGAILEKWTKHNWNRHVMLYFDKQQQLLGGFDFGSGAACDPAYHRAAWLTKNYADYNLLGPRPCELAVRQFLRRNGAGVRLDALRDA